LQAGNTLIKTLIMKILLQIFTIIHCKLW
jgi:hypothetical protein